MFAASHPFAFFDYFRVPYAVLPPEGGGLPAHVGRLGTRADGPALLWFRAGADVPAGQRRPLRRWSVNGSTLAGRLLASLEQPAFLRAAGSGWRPAQTLLDDHGHPVARVWRHGDGSVFLPFDPGEVMQSLWSERYTRLSGSPLPAAARAAVLRSYYLARPAIPRSAQLALRRGFTRVQARSPFPRWPLEVSLHDLYAWLFRLVAGIAGRPVPWLAPWPDGRSWALVLTHDVETEAGCRDIELLRGPERALGYRSSWNLVPERYPIEPGTVEALRAQGCEIGVHGLRHDGRDLGSRVLLRERLPRIRAAAQRWQAVGFRSPATQRVWEWMPLLGFEYDSSYPDTDPYEPQPGGCCTYLPFFNEEMVELPITLPQDHTVFTILGHAGSEVWLHKARAVRARGGMVLALTHPDYAGDPRVRRAWQDLLEEFHGDPTVWHALPCEAAAWWRRRAASRVVPDPSRSGPGAGWGVEGPAAGEARVRLATADGDGGLGDGDGGDGNGDGGPGGDGDGGGGEGRW